MQFTFLAKFDIEFVEVIGYKERSDRDRPLILDFLMWEP